MRPTTAGTFRVLASPREADELLFVDVTEYEPTYVPRSGHGDLDDAVADLRPGFLVGATLEWDDGDPLVVDLDVRKRTLFEFVDGATGIFEAATETWQRAVAEGEAMNSRVTRDTDGEANGVLYVFAEQSGARDLFDEFRSGVRPLEPLLERVNERDDENREVFVMRPADEPFVLAYIVLRREGLLADTMRDTYDCPREGDD